MSVQTTTEPAIGRSGFTILIFLVLFSVLAGSWNVAGFAATMVWPLLLSPALGMPALIPAIRFWPMGETTHTVWLIDLFGAAVMLIAAVLWLRAVSRKTPTPSRGRIFGRAIWVTVVAVVLANIVRGVCQSFILRSDLATFAGQMLGNIFFSALTALLLGVVIGVIAALVGERKAVR